MSETDPNEVLKLAKSLTERQRAQLLRFQKEHWRRDGKTATGGVPLAMSKRAPTPLEKKGLTVRRHTGVGYVWVITPLGMAVADALKVQPPRRIGVPLDEIAQIGKEDGV